MLKFFKPSLTAAMLAATFSFSSLAADQKATLSYPVVQLAAGI